MTGRIGVTGCVVNHIYTHTVVVSAVVHIRKIPGDIICRVLDRKQNEMEKDGKGQA
jgi:hypothetical protein